MAEINFPFGAASVQAPAYAATLAVNIDNASTVLDLGTLTGATTVNLTIGANVPDGATLVLRAKSDGTARTVTLGTGFLGLAITGVINKAKTCLFVKQGAVFVQVGASAQID